MNNPIWPEITYEPWKDTCHTLHRWIQLVGKVRTHLAPWTNHAWHSTLYVTATGLTTSLIPHSPHPFSIDFDFIRHRLILECSDGRRKELDLKQETVSSFYQRFYFLLQDFDLHPHFKKTPDEVSDPIPFSSDTTHCTYDHQAAQSFWKALVQVHRVMSVFRTRFIGKCSPIHLFWGSLDLALTRFSGRRAPEHPAGFPYIADKIVKEAYSHEVSSCGFWPGNEMLPEPAFYAYAYPQPMGYEKSQIPVKGAYYHPTLREFILPYESIRKERNMDEILLTFFQSTFEAAANLGKWDRDLLEQSYFLEKLQKEQKKVA